MSAITASLDLIMACPVRMVLPAQSTLKEKNEIGQVQFEPTPSITKIFPVRVSIKNGCANKQKMCGTRFRSTIGHGYASNRYRLRESASWNKEAT